MIRVVRVLTLSAALACTGAAPAAADLSVLPGPAGCTAQPAEPPMADCEAAPGLLAARALAIDGSGRVYVAAEESFAVTALRRGDDGRLLFSGCLSDDGTDGRFGYDGTCRDGDGLSNPVAVAAAPDASWVYALGQVSDSLAVARPDPAGGAPLPAACVADRGHARCADGTALGGPRALAVSPDGQNVYVAAGAADGILSFAVDHSTGVPTQIGCITDNGTDGVCIDGEALRGAGAVAVSPDGRHVYVGASTSHAMSVFAREPDGSLRQVGCVVDHAPPGPCASAFGLRGVNDLAMSPDGSRLYATAGDSNAVTAFARDAATGALRQVACLAVEGGPGCRPGTALTGPTAVAARPSGALVVTAEGSSAVVDVAVDPGTGALIQRSCIAQDQIQGCAQARGLDSPADVAVAPDGRIHVASTNAVLTLAEGPAVASSTLRMLAGSAAVPVRCPSARSLPCHGRIVLQGRRHGRLLPLGSGAFRVSPGSTRTVSVRVGSRTVRGRVQAMVSLRESRTWSALVPVALQGRKHP